VFIANPKDDRASVDWMNVDLLRGALDYIQDNQQKFLDALRLHVELSLYALLFGILIFVPLGVLASRWRGGPALVGFVSALRVIPSISVLFLLYPYRRDIGQFVPFWDRNFVLALIALTLLAGPPLIINTDAALRGVSPSVLENAQGLGMTGPQVFSKVQLPLALPVLTAGVRTAAVEVIASATFAAFIGVGTLGRFITSGLTLYDFSLLLVGAIPVTLLALGAEVSLAGFQRLVSTPA
jgi:osmoprotectant transport system permease protein